MINDRERLYWDVYGIIDMVKDEHLREALRYMFAVVVSEAEKAIKRQRGEG